MSTKICKKCGEEKELSEFYKSENNKDGFRSLCKKCMNNESIKWGRNHPEKINIYCRKWAKNNPEKVRKLKNRWRENNPKKYKISWNKWRKNNLEKWNGYCKKWYNNNKGKVKKTQQLYLINNPEKIKEKNKRRRNLKYNAEGFHTEQEWQEKKKECGYRCAYCGIHESVLKNKYKDKRWWKLTEDHVLALKKGGSDYITNIIPACISCNTSKGDKII